MSQKVGIKSIMLFVGFTLGVQQQISEGMEDGKFTVMEGLGLLPSVTEIPKLINEAPKLMQEVADLDEQERADLHRYVQDNFNIENDKIEAAIEESIDYGFQTWRYISRMGRILKPQA